MESHKGPNDERLDHLNGPYEGTTWLMRGELSNTTKKNKGKTPIKPFKICLHMLQL